MMSFASLALCLGSNLEQPSSPTQRLYAHHCQQNQIIPQWQGKTEKARRQQPQILPYFPGRICSMFRYLYYV